MLDHIKRTIAGLFNRAEPAYLLNANRNRQGCPRTRRKAAGDAGVSPAGAPSAAPGQAEE